MTPVEVLTDVIGTQKYKDRIKKIERLYFNNKNENRYRDAILECIDEDYEMSAFSEVNRCDLFIKDSSTQRAKDVRVELKYYYDFDVSERLKKCDADYIKGELKKGKSIVKSIYNDCFREDKPCDLFLLIIHQGISDQYRTVSKKEGIRSAYIGKREKFSEGSELESNVRAFFDAINHHYKEACPKERQRKIKLPYGFHSTVICEKEGAKIHHCLVDFTK
jgi:hypothetical protein